MLDVQCENFGKAHEILCGCELLQTPAGAAVVASMGHLQREQGNLEGCLTAALFCYWIVGYCYGVVWDGHLVEMPHVIIQNYCFHTLPAYAYRSLGALPRSKANLGFLEDKCLQFMPSLSCSHGHLIFMSFWLPSPGKKLAHTQ